MGHIMSRGRLRSKWSPGTIINPATDGHVLFSKDSVMTLPGDGLFQSSVSESHCSSPCSVFCSAMFNDLGDLPMESEDIFFVLN